MDTLDDVSTTAGAFAAAARPFTAVVDAVPADRWDAPSPCDAWSAREVVRHVVDTERSFLADRDLPLTGELPDVGTDPAAAWRAHARAVADLLADPQVAARPFDGWFGPTTVGQTLEQFYVWDLYVHRTDIARACGLMSSVPEAALTEDELDRIEAGADAFGDALYMDGICRPAVEVPDDAARATKVLGRLGRPA